MNKDLEITLWIICLLIFIGLADINEWFIFLLVPFSLYMGAYFRGKNWFIGWEKVKWQKMN